MDEAIAELEKLLTKVEAEEWVNALAKRFMMSGIRLSIRCLHHAKIARKDNGTT